MEKTGLINRFLIQQDRNHEMYHLLHNSREAQNYNSGLQENISFLQEIKSAKDIMLFLGVEEIMLRQELAVYTNSPEQHNSITMAIEQLQDAKKSLNVVKTPEQYRIVAATYPANQKEAGLPVDSFRAFLKSHSTRLTNRMASALSVPEKNLLRQRKENLVAVKELYIALQREALRVQDE